jgi:predicted nucleic acid-binding protein
MVKTYLDSGVLLTGWRSLDAKGELAIAVIEDANRHFYISQLSRLELLPKARFFKQHDEIEFYETHFARAVANTPLTRGLGARAEQLAARYGLAAIDALHLAAAIHHGVEEFITTEKPDKPMFRVRELKVTALASLSI